MSIAKDFPYINKWQSQQNLGIDAVASAITWHRAKRLPLKTIFISTRYWNSCLHWLEAQRKQGRITDEQFDGVVIEKKFDFDTIEIRPSELLLSSQPMIFEFFEKATEEQLQAVN